MLGQVGTLGIGPNPRSVFVSGRYAYVVDLSADDFRVIDVADPSVPAQVGSLGIGPNPRSVDMCHLRPGPGNDCT